MKKIILAILLTMVPIYANAFILSGILGKGNGAVTYAPSAPTVSASAGNASATVTITAGAVDGLHSAATDYTVTSSPAGGTDTNAGTSSLTHTITGLTNGTAYTFTAVAHNSAGTSSASAASGSVTPTASTTGLIDFETASLTPNSLTGAYTNNNSTYASRSTTVAHGGTYSMKFTANTTSPYGELVRTVTFPSTGTYTFSRWIYVSALTNTSDGLAFGVAPDTTPSGFSAIVQYFDNTSTGGIRYGTGGAYTVLYPSSSMSANTWYKISVNLNCATNTYDIYLYNSALTQLASATGQAVFGGSFSNSTRYIYTGRSYTSGAPTYYVDDMIDGL